MFDRYNLIVLLHLIFVGLLLKISALYLPSFLTSYFTSVAHIIILFIVARLTFIFTKKKFLNEKVYPRGKAVLITGCDTGFGNAFALRMYSRGYLVFACCLNEKSEGAEELRKKDSERMKVLGLDVTSSESVERAVNSVKENLGSSDLWAVVNNAGVFKGFSIEFTRIENFSLNFEVNALGVVRVTKAFIPLLKLSKGRVVNVTSLAGRLPMAHMTPYTMSKYASVAFTECLRLEMLQSGIKAISIEPEAFKTPMTSVRTITPEYRESKEHVKEAHEETSLQNVRNFFLVFSSICSPKVHKVLDDMESAVTLKYPDGVYRPCRNALMSICCYITVALPSSVREVLFNLLFHASVILKRVSRRKDV